MNVIPITNERGEVVDAALLAGAESVHRQLRPQLPRDYVKRMKEVFAGGAEMAVCLVDGKVAGITVFRVLEKTFTGRELYCDDLVTDERQRSTGVGHALIAYMEEMVKARGCDAFTLDSGCQREQAHKFYFREGMTVTAFHFTMKKKDPPPAPSQGRGETSSHSQGKGKGK
jgi:GNAT superfamily N-acetyltransferase